MVWLPGANEAVWLCGLVQTGHAQGLWLLQKGMVSALMDKDIGITDGSTVGVIAFTCAHPPSG